MKRFVTLIAFGFLVSVGLIGCPDVSGSGDGDGGTMGVDRDARVEGSGGMDTDADPMPDPDAAPMPDPDAAPMPDPDAAPRPDPDAAPEPEPDAAPVPDAGGMECPGRDIPEEWPPPSPAGPYLLFGTVNASAGEVVSVPVYLVGNIPLAVGLQWDAEFDWDVMAPIGPDGDPPTVSAGRDAVASGHFVQGRARQCFVRVLVFSVANAAIGDVDGDLHREVAVMTFRVNADAPLGRTVITPADTTCASVNGALACEAVAGSVVVE